MKRFKTQQIYLLFIFILSSFVISGCGGGGDTTGHWLPTDTTAPWVTSVVPLNGAVGVAINTRITATFSEDMDPATINGTTFRVVNTTLGGTAVAGNVTYNAASRTATFTPTIPATLPVSTLFTATITTGAKDIRGHALVSNYVWSFTTGLAPDKIRPRVVSTIPANGAVVAPINAVVTAIFTKNMAPATITAASFTLVDTTTGGTAVAGVVTYDVASRTATFTPGANLTAGDVYTATITTAATDLSGNALAGNQAPLPAASNYIWTFTASAADLIAPTVTLTAPADLAAAVVLNSTVNATFSKDMNPLTISTATFTLQVTGPPLGAPLGGTVSYVPLTRIATFTPTLPLLANTNYTATVTNGAKDLAGNALVVPAVGLPPNPWTFTTGTGIAPGAVPLGLASTFGTFGGSAGMTNSGNLTLIDGDIGTISTTNASITGFHEGVGNVLTDDAYTDTLGANSGAVAGEIYTCTNSTTGPNSAVNLAPATSNAADCALATQARLDAQTAFIALAAMPSTGALAGNLAGLTITPGVYTNATSVLIQGGNLTLDAQGDANAVFVFQIGSTLTVGGPGVAFPQSIILAGGAQAKNVFWQVGTSATINAAGGGTMEGTIIANSGIVFSTAGNVAVLTLNGRALSLISSVTMVNTVINVPLP
jgi:hypothetical protein